MSNKDEILQKKYVECEEYTVILQKGIDNSPKGKIVLKNITQNYIVYKIYMNKENTYTLTQSTGFILPEAKTEIGIRRNFEVKSVLQKDFDEKDLADEKFMIRAFPINGSVTSVISSLLNRKQIVGNWLLLKG
jgi:hypothetical protein